MVITKLELENQIRCWIGFCYTQMQRTSFYQAENQSAG